MVCKALFSHSRFAGIVYRKQGRRFAHYAIVRLQLLGCFIGRSVFTGFNGQRCNTLSDPLSGKLGKIPSFGASQKYLSLEVLSRERLYGVTVWRHVEAVTGASARLARSSLISIPNSSFEMRI